MQKTKSRLPKRKARSKLPKTITKRKTYTDGKLIFKSRELLNIHVLLQKMAAEKKITSFYVPNISDRSQNKYGAIKIMIDDHTFDSKLEAEYYLYLLEQLELGEIKEFSIQPVYELQPRFTKRINGKVKTYRKIEYRADFLVRDKNNETLIIDTKGRETDIFKMKQKMFEYVYPDLHLLVVKKVRGKWVTV